MTDFHFVVIAVAEKHITIQAENPEEAVGFIEDITNFTDLLDFGNEDVKDVHLVCLEEPNQEWQWMPKYLIECVEEDE